MENQYLFKKFFVECLDLRLFLGMETDTYL